MAAISSRFTGLCDGAAEALVTVGLAAGLGAFIGLVSKATRFISSKWIGDTLSEVTLPPHEPQPSVIDGGRSVENPIAPCVVGELMTTREAGIFSPYRTAASRSVVCMPAV